MRKAIRPPVPFLPDQSAQACPSNDVPWLDCVDVAFDNDFARLESISPLYTPQYPKK